MKLSGQTKAASGRDAARRRTPPPGGTTGTLETAEGVALRLMCWRPERARGTVLLVPGRTEYIERHFETAADLLDRTYAVAVMEMRGHGQSARPLANPYKHHVRDFAAMIDDVTRLFAYVRKSGLPAPYHVLAHSMGAHVVLHALHDQPDAVTAAVLTAPMLGLRLSGLPRPLVRTLARAAVRLGLGTRYAPGQTDWRGGKPREILRDVLTSDRERFADEDWILARQAGLRLGGVTWGWLDAAFRSMHRFAEPGYVEAISTPVLMVLGGADRVIDNDAAQAVAARLPRGTCVVIEGARHDILHESDRYRDRFWAAFDRFIDALPSN